ncbi:hypothetical protein EST92_11740 [Streptomyces sp. TM32]|uniref:hypothetical protein n=1 Tax=Streptomyces sp. TM32 TaxID=1652669 RepID=UPI0010107849|nr:hypothetical protein [Streptomyces sp. TM32]RXS84223.1 hypothetical protein EST92_11740 [Streptomyces sp. TM32]
MSLKESAANAAAQALDKVFKQLDDGKTDRDDVRAANSAMDLAAVFGVTAQDYAQRLGGD